MKKREIKEYAGYALVLRDTGRIAADIERQSLMEIYKTKKAAKLANEDSIFDVIPVSIIM